MDINDIWLTNIRFLVDTQHNGRQAGLAEKLGKQPNVISRLFSNNPDHRRNVTSKLVHQIEDLYQLPNGWMNILHNNEDQVALLNLQEAPTTSMMHDSVPLISWVQASTWRETTDSIHAIDAEEKLACPTSHGQNTFALRVRGISMEPKYQDGDIIFVDPDEPATHGRNVVMILEKNKEATFKQLFIEGKDKYLQALNPELLKRPITEVNEDTRICGVVIGKWVPE